ncbi:MAG: nuclear transport factor 2 family protein, partial [Trebonia sp.]
ELLARLDRNGEELAWPVAVVAESPDDLSVVFRTYCSQWPTDERRHVRPPILEPGPARPGDVVGRDQAALAAGDTDTVVSTFAPDGYFRGPSGPRYADRGPAELRSFFARCFSAGGGIVLQDCAVTEPDLEFTNAAQTVPSTETSAWQRRGQSAAMMSADRDPRS